MRGALRLCYDCHRPLREGSKRCERSDCPPPEPKPKPKRKRVPVQLTLPLVPENPPGALAVTRDSSRKPKRKRGRCPHCRAPLAGEAGVLCHEPSNHGPEAMVPSPQAPPMVSKGN